MAASRAGVCGFVVGRGARTGARLLVGFRVVINRIETSPLGIVPVPGRVELLSRTMGVG
jgi:hypothetical protein